MPNNTDSVARLRAAEAARTPGVWETNTFGDVMQDGETHLFVASAAVTADAAYIATCTECVPALLERLKNQRESIANLSGGVAKCYLQNQQLRSRLASYAKAIEAMDQKLQQECDEEDWIVCYRVPTGPWHKLLAMARDEPALQTPSEEATDLPEVGPLLERLAVAERVCRVVNQIEQAGGWNDYLEEERSAALAEWRERYGDE